MNVYCRCNLEIYRHSKFLPDQNILSLLISNTFSCEQKKIFFVPKCSDSLWQFHENIHLQKIPTVWEAQEDFHQKWYPIVQYIHSHFKRKFSYLHENVFSLTPLSGSWQKTNLGGFHGMCSRAPILAPWTCRITSWTGLRWL